MNYNDEKKDGTVYTCNAALIRKMDRLTAQYPEDVRLFREDEVSKSYYVPKRWLKISPPRKTNITDRQREILSERMRAIKQHRLNSAV